MPAWVKGWSRVLDTDDLPFPLPSPFEVVEEERRRVRARARAREDGIERLRSHGSNVRRRSASAGGYPCLNTPSAQAEVEDLRESSSMFPQLSSSLKDRGEGKAKYVDRSRALRF